MYKTKVKVILFCHILSMQETFLLSKPHKEQICTSLFYYQYNIDLLNKYRDHNARSFI